MCPHGDTVMLWVTVDASVSHSGETELKMKPIDRCISDIVLALEGAGIFMLGSCCGHGDRDGEIVLTDGGVLIVKQPT